MPNYTLTQTGQEVQDILDSMGATYFFSEVCSTWASDSTYADYPYKGTIPLVGVDGTMGVEVTFSMTDAISGNYSPICNTTNDAVEIWSKKNTSITIPTIKITKNGYVNLNGSSNYMPQSGGNFTGAISVNGSDVVTKSSLSKIIQFGRTGAVTATAGAYTDYAITFPQAFNAPPEIMVCLRATSTSMGYAMLEPVVLNNSVTATGFTVRVYNGHTSGLSPYVVWYAIGNM